MRNVYKVAGGWQAEDETLFMACFGFTAEDAQQALEAARERAAQIAQRIAMLPEVDEPLSKEDLAQIELARAEAARGEARLVRPR